MTPANTISFLKKERLLALSDVSAHMTYNKTHPFAKKYIRDYHTGQTRNAFKYACVYGRILIKAGVKNL